MNLICIQLLFNDLISIPSLSFKSDYLNQNLFVLMECCQRDGRTLGYLSRHTLEKKVSATVARLQNSWNHGRVWVGRGP